MPGVEQLIDSLDLEDKIKQANVIITGEGCLDEQSMQGKVVGTIARFAQKYSKRVRVLCGENQLQHIDLGPQGIEQVVSLASIAGDKNFSIAEPEKFIGAAIKEIFS